MPFDPDDARRWLDDIHYHITLAEHFAQGMDYVAFSDDLRTTYAVTRCLEIISEASRRLPQELKERHPEIEWQQMASAGNVYRHEYEDVGAKNVWDTLTYHLPPLREAIGQELEAARPEPGAPPEPMLNEPPALAPDIEPEP